MTRKRFIKLAMSCGYSRNAANDFAKTNISKTNYFMLWFALSADKYLQAIGQPCEVNPHKITLVTIRPHHK